MTETSKPFNEQNLTEEDWARLFALLRSGGVFGDPGSSVLQVFADASGMNVFRRVGEGFVRGVIYGDDAQKTIAIPSNGGASARIDRIILKLDPTADTILTLRKPGTIGAGPPVLEQDVDGVYEVPLAQVRVEPGVTNIAANKVADDRMSVGVDVWPVLAVAQILSPRQGQLASESSTDLLKRWNGSTWRTVVQAPLAGEGFPAKVRTGGARINEPDANGRLNMDLGAGIPDGATVQLYRVDGAGNRIQIAWDYFNNGATVFFGATDVAGNAIPWGSEGIYSVTQPA